MARSPPPAGAKGQRGWNREAGCPSSCPAHSSFSYRFYRSAAEAERRATSHQLQIGSGRERLEKASPTSGGNCGSVQDGPRTSTRLGAEPCFISRSPGDVEWEAVSLGLIFPICQPKGWSKSNLGTVPILTMIIMTTVTRVNTQWELTGGRRHAVTCIILSSPPNTVGWVLLLFPSCG